MLNAIRGSVTLIGPHDALIIRVPWDTPAGVLDDYGDYLYTRLTELGWRSRFIVLPAEQIAVMVDGEDPGEDGELL